MATQALVQTGTDRYPTGGTEGGPRHCQRWEGSIEDEKVRTPGAAPLTWQQAQHLSSVAHLSQHPLPSGPRHTQARTHTEPALGPGHTAPSHHPRFQSQASTGHRLRAPNPAQGEVPAQPPPGCSTQGGEAGVGDELPGPGRSHSCLELPTCQSARGPQGPAEQLGQEGARGTRTQLCQRAEQLGIRLEGQILMGE